MESFSPKKQQRKFLANEIRWAKPLSLSGYGNYIVTGVFEDFPGKTHFDFEVLASINAFLFWKNKILYRLPCRIGQTIMPVIFI